MESLAEMRETIANHTRAPRSKASVELAIKAFFGGNALVAIVVLTLITIFLFREGFGFFGQNLANLRVYRQAGLEYVDIIRAESETHAALSRSLSTLRLRDMRALQNANASAEQIDATLAPFDQFATAFSDTGENLNGLLSDLTDQASAAKEQIVLHADVGTREGNAARDAALAKLREGSAAFETVSSAMTAKIYDLLASAPKFSDVKTQQAFEKWKSRARDYLAGLPAPARQHLQRLGGKTTRLVAGCPGAVVSIDQLISFRPRMDHRELLAGLVWDHSVARRIGHGLDRRISDCRSAWSRVRDLRERNRIARREAVDQALH